MPSPPAPHGPPVPSGSSRNLSTDRAVMTQFCSTGEFVSSNGILSNSPTRRVPASVPRPISSNYLPSAFAAQSKDNSSDVWIRDSGASCHMTNYTRKMYCGKPPPSDQRAVTTSDGTRQGVEYIGNVDVVFHGRSDESSRCAMSRMYRA